MARGNYILYALESVIGAASLLTFTASGQEYLQVLLLIVLVTGALHAVVSGITVCGYKKWIMIAFNSIPVIIAIIMLILNTKTDVDNSATPATVAVGWEWKVALSVSVAILPLANLILVGNGSQWRCSQGLTCTNPEDLDALKASARRYFNADRGESKPLSGPLARNININDFMDDQLDTKKIAYITVDAEGKDSIDCARFKQDIDNLTSQTLTSKKKVQIAQRQEQNKLSYEAAKPLAAQQGILGAGPLGVGQQPVKYADPTGKPQYGYQGGGLFGAGAQKQQLVAPPPPLPTQNPFKQQIAQAAKAKQVSQLDTRMYNNMAAATANA